MSGRSRCWSVVALCAAAVLAVGAAGAGASTPDRTTTGRAPAMGAESRISPANATANDEEPGVAWNRAADEFLVVWADERNAVTRGSDIYGRRVSTAGKPIGAAFRVSGAGAVADDTEPGVAWNRTTNQYLVIWTDARRDSTRGTDIYGRLLTASGQPVAPDFRIVGRNAKEDDRDAEVTWNEKANEFLVVWADRRNWETRDTDVYARRVSAAGAPLGPDFRISGVGGTAGDSEPDVAWNAADNEYLVVWKDGRNRPTRGDDAYGKRVSAAGKTLGVDFRISGPQALDDERMPAVAWSTAAGGYLVVWSDERSYDTRGQDIYGHRVSGAGVPTGSDFRISGMGATSYDIPADLAWNGAAKEYLVVWMDWRNYYTRGRDIYGRRVSVGGSPLGPDFRVCGLGALGHDETPAVAWSRTSNAHLVVWQDYRNFEARGADIYGRRVAG